MSEWVSKEVNYFFVEGYLTIKEIKEGDPLYVKGKTFLLDGEGCSFYSSLASAKSAARRYYGAGIKWIKKNEEQK